MIELARPKRLLIGRPRPTRDLEHTLLPKFLALPVFSSDPISSVAYATEAALAVLVASSLSSAHLVFPLSIAISIFMVIVVFSYVQGVKAYASSGGSYVFARENLGTLPALVAGASLMVDYVLTVAVSVAAGVFALTSAVPGLESHRVALSLGCIVILTLGNLRGVRESGFLFAFPTYGFLLVMYATLAVGVGKCAFGTCPQATVPHPLAAGAGVLTVFVVLKAFASGSVALTGTESISNGVTAFKHPQAQNAARTLMIMVTIAVTLFLGVSWLAVKMHALPSSTDSVLSQIGRAAFPAHSTGSVVYYLLQAFTLAILVLAANTSYQGFPRLAALLARDKFVPRQFGNLGDRLVFSNGIVILAAFSAVLIVAFRANVNSLIHLYVIGVFTAFTLAQTGMVSHWFRHRDGGLALKATLNGVGAAVTALVDGDRDRDQVRGGRVDGDHRDPGADRRSSTGSTSLPLDRTPPARQGARRARPAGAGQHRRPLRRAAGRGHARGALVRADDRERQPARDPRPLPGQRPGIRPRFFELAEGSPHLEILEPEDEPLDAVFEYIWALPARRGRLRYGGHPRALPASRRSCRRCMRRSTFLLKLRLLREPGVVVTDVSQVSGLDPRFRAGRAECVVPVSGVSAVSAACPRLRARRSAWSGRGRSSSPSRRTMRSTSRRDWGRLGLDIPLEVDRGALPRSRRAAPRLPPRDHGRSRNRGHRRHARAGRARHRPAPAQPARALPQAAPALRAARDPHERSVPAPVAGSTNR